MSSTRSAPPLVIEPRPSRLLITLLGLVHVAGAGVILSLPLPAWQLALLLACVLLNLVRVLRNTPGIRRRGRVYRLTWKADGSWWLEEYAGDSYSLRLSASSFVHPWLVVLNFSRAGKGSGVSVPLLPDALDPARFRQLRVRLGLEGTNPNTA